MTTSIGPRLCFVGRGIMAEIDRDRPAEHVVRAAARGVFKNCSGEVDCRTNDTRAYIQAT